MYMYTRKFNSFPRTPRMACKSTCDQSNTHVSMIKCVNIPSSQIYNNKQPTASKIQ